jgi:hypothetical protein
MGTYQFVINKLLYTLHTQIFFVLYLTSYFWGEGNLQLLNNISVIMAINFVSVVEHLIC